MTPTRRSASTLARRRRGSADRGSTSIEMVILLPALFALMFLGMQAALMYQGRAVALAAAQEGAREAASETGTAVSGIRTAEAFVAASTSGLKNTTVEGQRTATEATLTVRATTLSVIPGWTPTITQSASMPVERVT
ncbi:MAG TPA: TadE/TadG family type IV pilus assembly protein [Propionibacteriaceae bacterium]|jgi:Flp pilus assembly protein TadG